MGIYVKKKLNTLHLIKGPLGLVKSSHLNRNKTHKVKAHRTYCGDCSDRLSLMRCKQYEIKLHHFPQVTFLEQLSIWPVPIWSKTINTNKNKQKHVMNETWDQKFLNLNNNAHRHLNYSFVFSLKYNSYICLWHSSF